jgi:hypothetical protein
MCGWSQPGDAEPTHIAFVCLRWSRCGDLALLRGFGFAAGPLRSPPALR